MTLRYVGSKNLGNRYILSSSENDYSYSLELDEEQVKKEKFVLTTGQRWANPPLKGQKGSRVLPISGGWPTSLRSLSVNSAIISMAKDRISKIAKKYIAVHYRNTDMKHDIGEIISATSEAIDISGLRDIFLATDDIDSKERFIEAFPGINIHSFSNIPNLKKLGQNSIHYMSNIALEKSGLSKRNQIIDALCDIICLQKSTIFIPSKTSAMSQIVMYLRDEKELRHNFLGSGNLDI